MQSVSPYVRKLSTAYEKQITASSSVFCGLKNKIENNVIERILCMSTQIFSIFPSLVKKSILNISQTTRSVIEINEKIFIPFKNLLLKRMFFTYPILHLGHNLMHQ